MTVDFMMLHDRIGNIALIGTNFVTSITINLRSLGLQFLDQLKANV